jgi:hypothetical protein
MCAAPDASSPVCPDENACWRPRGYPQEPPYQISCPGRRACDRTRIVRARISVCRGRFVTLGKYLPYLACTGPVQVSSMVGREGLYYGTTQPRRLPYYRRIKNRRCPDRTAGQQTYLPETVRSGWYLRPTRTGLPAAESLRQQVRRQAAQAPPERQSPAAL